MFNNIKKMNKLFELKNNGDCVVKLGRFTYVSIEKAKRTFQTDLDNWWTF